MTFKGTKIIKAVAMCRCDAEGVLGRRLDQYGQEDGYLVEYDDGHTAWLPALPVGEACERRVMLSSFGLAIDALKAGKRVARKGWNGKGMWLRYVHPYAPHPDAFNGGPVGNVCLINPYFKAADNNEHAEGTMLPWIGMKTADNMFVPWLASQTDMLADDWVIVE